MCFCYFETRSKVCPYCGPLSISSAKSCKWPKYYNLANLSVSMSTLILCVEARSIHMKQGSEKCSGHSHYQGLSQNDKASCGGKKKLDLAQLLLQHDIIWQDAALTGLIHAVTPGVTPYFCWSPQDGKGNRKTVRSAVNYHKTLPCSGIWYVFKTQHISTVTEKPLRIEPQ